MIKKTPFNYSNDMDRRRQGLDSIIENLLPDVTIADAGKIVKVDETGKWILGDDENTIIEANPEDQPTVDLENLKIGDTVYSVKNPELTTVKSFKLTMSNGGQYNTNKPIIEFYNEAGQKAAITSTDYTVTCDKTYAGNANMDQVCSITTSDTPGTFTYTFVNDFDIETYNLIKLTRGGTFVNDIAKNIKLELSADGENYLTIYDETTITWSDAVPYHLISLKDGSEASTILPIVTSSDNGKVLGVVNGEWDKMNIPSSADVYYLELIKSGSSYELPITFNELCDLIANKKCVFLVLNDFPQVPTSRKCLSLVNYDISGSNKYVDFMSSSVQNFSPVTIRFLRLYFTGVSATLSTLDVISST